MIEREVLHTSEDDLRYYVEQFIDSTAENISSMLQGIRAMHHTEIDLHHQLFTQVRPRACIAVPENSRLFEYSKAKGE